MSTPTFPMLIGGQSVISDSLIPVTNPATGEVFGQVPDLTASQAQDCLTAAQKGFQTWSAMTPAERRILILKYADLLESNRERLIALLIEETGKPRDNAKYDFGMLTTCLRFFVEEAERLDQPVLHDPEGRFLHYIQRQPLGVVVGFLAWNFPLLNVGYKIGPALAAGCSIILKPATLTPVATLEVARLAKEAGLPDGVLNVITSGNHDIPQILTESEIPALITMIGSTRSGLQVMNNSLTTVKHFSVELGGNAPVIVYPDANVAAAANKIVDLKYANSGQVCVSPNRCFVHEDIYDEFLAAALARTADVEIGPMMSELERDRILATIKEAVAQGATIVCGGEASDGPGYYMEPTILTDVSRAMRLSCEEIFGPVLSLLKFSHNDDEIALANATEFGLAAYVFTTNLPTGLRAARDIKAGSVCINEPHYSVQLPHGGLKQSGIGKDCSKYSLEEYLTLKRISVLIDHN